jgi:phosphohistidine phosphatase
MKKLFLIRHAKSGWDDRDQPDLERPLNPKGEKDAPVMAEELAKRIPPPDLILSSPANRALRTAQIFASGFGIAADSIVVETRIYEAGIRELMDVVREIDDKIESVFLFGHNPGLTSFTNLLGNKFFPEMPTCAVAGIEFELDSWSAIERWCGKIFLFDYPKKHSL